MHRLYMDKQGRVTIPSRIRRELNLGEETALFAELDSGKLVLRSEPSARGENQTGEEHECVLSRETLAPAERRRILHRLLG